MCIRDRYKVVRAPIGARFPQLPTNAKRFERNSNVYHASETAFFRESYDDRGDVYYEVVDMR